MPIIFLVNALCNLFKLQMCMAIYCHALLQHQQDTACATMERKDTVAGLLRNAMKRSEWLFEAPRHTFSRTSSELGQCLPQTFAASGGTASSE